MIEDAILQQNSANLLNESKIKFNLISEIKSIRPGKKINFVCGVELELESNQNENRQPVDIVCLIDNSESMSGLKASLVRKSLKFLLKILNKDDQVSLISFDSNAKVLCSLVKNNDENKKQLKKSIKKITGTGCTLVLPGFKQALKLLKSREMKREQTFVLLLTDGEFTDNLNIHHHMSQLVNQFEMDKQFYIYTYGYGDDTNPEVLQEIARRFEGKYSLISNVQQITDWFLLSVSSFLKCACKEISIKIKEKTRELISIKQTIGGEIIWKNQNFEERNFEIYVPLLINGDKKIFVFECTFDSQFDVNDANKNQIFLEAELTYNQVEVDGIKKQITMNTNLGIEYLSQNQIQNENMEIEQINNNKNNKKEKEQIDSIANTLESYYENLIVTFYRGLGGKAIKESSDIIQSDKNFSKAKHILNEFKKNIMQNCKFMENKGIQHLLEDINDAIEKCHPQKYYRGHFQKMNAVHERRSRSRSHDEDWNDENKDTLNKYRRGNIVLSDSESVSRSGSRSSHSDDSSIENSSQSDSSSDSDRSSRSHRRYNNSQDRSESPAYVKNSNNNYQRNNRFRQNNRQSQNGYNRGRQNQRSSSRSNSRQRSLRSPRSSNQRYNNNDRRDQGRSQGRSYRRNYNSRSRSNSKPPSQSHSRRNNSNNNQRRNKTSYNRN